mmetsp:Transcript_8297/g.28583  ORF Transcript_8297/g.28583 Transcript_8297/m.28583 type:complete len:220 (-) Transcript_8297:169-828(-)
MRRTAERRRGGFRQDGPLRALHGPGPSRPRTRRRLSRGPPGLRTFESTRGLAARGDRVGQRQNSLDGATAGSPSRPAARACAFEADLSVEWVWHKPETNATQGWSFEVKCTRNCQLQPFGRRSGNQRLPAGPLHGDTVTYKASFKGPVSEPSGRAPASASFGAAGTAECAVNCRLQGPLKSPHALRLARDRAAAATLEARPSDCPRARPGDAAEGQAAE